MVSLRLVLLAAVLGAAACGGSSITDADNGSPADGFAHLIDPHPVVRLTARGIEPQVTHLEATTEVVFVNESSEDYVIVSAPDLQYGPCPEVDAVGRVPPGGSRRLVVGRALFCAYRHAGRAGNHAFEGLLYTH